MSTINLKCSICHSDFPRNRSEYNRSQKLGRPSYCSRFCSGHANRYSLGKHLGNGNVKNFGNNKGTRKDEYTPFRYIFRCCKRRFKEIDIDLKYLKEKWEVQQGKCSLTGWELQLPQAHKDFGVYRASLDRIDNSKGYIKGNIRFISVMANYCKNTFTDDDVKLFCEAVYHKKGNHSTTSEDSL